MQTVRVRGGYTAAVDLKQNMWQLIRRLYVTRCDGSGNGVDESRPPPMRLFQPSEGRYMMRYVLVRQSRRKTSLQ